MSGRKRSLDVADVIDVPYDSGRTGSEASTPSAVMLMIDILRTEPGSPAQLEA